MDSVSDNKTRQSEELEILQAVYPDLIEISDQSTYKINIYDGVDKEPLCLSIHYNENYPSNGPPGYQLFAEWMSDIELSELSSQLLDLYIDNQNGVIVYQWVIHIMDYINDPEFIQKRKDHLFGASSGANRTPKSSNLNNEKVKIQLPPLISGNTLTDRKSIFQAHVAEIHSKELVPLLLEELYKNKKIEKATHNIWAYRIYDEKTQQYIQENDDDGESAAGGRLALLLEMTGATNVLVVVSRWWGGPLLGSSRFKRICDVAAQLLEEQGFISKDKQSIEI